MPYRLSDFDYALPEELIAQFPTAQRSDSRLLVVRGNTLRDQAFTQIVDWLKPNDLLVFNNSKVIPARVMAQKSSGGEVEILVERLLGPKTASVLMRASRKPKPGAFVMARGHRLEVLGRDPIHADRFQIASAVPLLPLLDEIGQLPLPPYIAHFPGPEDERRYQTIYARHPGSVAAPTAGLHFDNPLLEKISQAGVRTAHLTLHVGSGTFAPVRSEDLREHRMHSEWCELSMETAAAIAEARASSGRIIAVGTTSMRTLESAAQRALTAHNAGVSDGTIDCKGLAGQWETDIFITPGHAFLLVDGLVTNFHLPKSTLLMLVSAFAGFDTIRRAYAHAIAQRYRFFSYGDAMLLERGHDEIARATEKSAPLGSPPASLA